MSIGFPYLLNLLSRMNEAGLEHHLEHQDQCILVQVHNATQRWEIKIFENGEMEIAIFERDPKTYRAEKLEELFGESQS